MIYEEVFRGSKVTYTGGPFSELYAVPDSDEQYQIEDVTDHRNILLASKQTRAEGIVLYYQHSKFTMNYSWTEDKILRYIPKVCRRHVRSLSAEMFNEDGVPLYWIDMDCKLRNMLPSLREIHLPRHNELHCQEAQDGDKILGEVKKALLLHKLPVYEAYKAAWKGLNVYQHIGVRITQHAWFGWYRELEFTVDCKSLKVISYPDGIDDTTTFEKFFRTIDSIRQLRNPADNV